MSLANIASELQLQLQRMERTVTDLQVKLDTAIALRDEAVADLAILEDSAAQQIAAKAVV